MSEFASQRSRVARCDGCGSRILGYVDGDPCPSCGEVVFGV